MARSKKTQAAIDDAMALPIVEGQVGLGVDMVNIARMRQILKRTPSFSKRVFSEEERAYCDGTHDPATHYAARFAAKEAVVKALGCGFAEGVGVGDIEVVRGRSGRPVAALSGRAAQIAAELGVNDIPISLSHTDNDAIACAIAITSSSVAAAKKRVDPNVELAQRFREARAMLDEI